MCLFRGSLKPETVSAGAFLMPKVNANGRGGGGGGGGNSGGGGGGAF
jgi:hypothetical protein